MERRYHSPYRHWVSGFLFEVGFLLLFIGFLSLLAFGVFALVG